MDLKTLSDEKLVDQFGGILIEFALRKDTDDPLPDDYPERLKAELLSRLDPQITTVESFPDRNLMRLEIVKRRDAAKHMFDDEMPPGGESHWSYQQSRGAMQALDNILTLFDDTTAKDPPVGDVGELIDRIESYIPEEHRVKSVKNGFKDIGVLRTAVAAIQSEHTLSRKMLADKCDQHMEAETKVLELQADSARLEFLPVLLARGYDYLIHHDGRWCFIPNENYKGEHPDTEYFGDTFNAAIDAAMKGESNGTN